MNCDLQATIWGNDSIRGEAKLLMLALAGEADADGCTSPSLDLLIQLTGLSRRTVQRYLVHLADTGWISALQHEAGRGKTRTWQLHAGKKGVTLTPFSPDQSVEKGDSLTPFIEKDANLTPFSEEKGVTLTPFLPDQPVEKGANLTPFVEKDASLTPFPGPKGDSLTPFSTGTEVALIELNNNITETTNVVSGARLRPADDQGQKTRRREDPFFRIFCAEFVTAGLGVGYDYQVQDFVQLAKMRRRLAAAQPEPILVADQEFTVACRNYFASDRTSYTLADLATRVTTFLRGPVDRYGQLKPVEALCNGTNKPNTVTRRETANERAARQTFELITGALATR